MRISFHLPLLTATLLSACASAAPAVVPGTIVSSAIPSSSTSSTAPSVVPSVGATASAAVTSPTPAASVKPAFAWTNGALLRSYDFKGVGGIFYEFSANTLYVLDGVDDNKTPERYLVREFTLDGTFTGAFHLAPPGKNDPDHVDGMAFDRRGTPFYTYRNDYDYTQAAANDTNDSNDFFGVYELITATVALPSGLPFHPQPREGLATLSSQDDTFTLGFIALDPDKTVTTHSISYQRAEENQQALAIFSIQDPFQPTALMSASADGKLFLSGPLPGGGFNIQAVDQNQKLTTFTTLDALPSRMWAGPNDEMYTTYDQTSKPAIVRKYGADGKLIGETSLSLPSGGYLLNIQGLTFDPKGRAIVTANGVDANNQPITGIYSFTE